METLYARSQNQGKCRFAKVRSPKGARKEEQWLGLEKVWCFKGIFGGFQQLVVAKFQKLAK